ncbi:hypothetical protein [Pseudobacter ginsenosidimutans]|nr:hypothetical protein [Pseudobacter ginsenosidimutans]QEC40926.1 hypothetical protein FSB84_04165 [Pseudobacter ginsenosidimutans]
MKLNLIILAICSCVAIWSCKEKPAQTPAETTAADSSATPNKEISYLPVGDLIREDIRRVDSFAAGILYKKESTKIDSSYINLETFKKMTAQFLLPELDSSRFQELFGHESFMDETTEMINFIYPAKDTGTSLRKVVVYIRPSLNVDKVNRIYMEKEFRDGNDFVQQKLTWVIEKYFYILTIRHPQKGEPVTSIEKVIWDPQSYAY